MIEGNATTHADSATRILILADEMQGLVGQLQTELEATASIWTPDAYHSARIHTDLQSAQDALIDMSTTVAADHIPG